MSIVFVLIILLVAWVVLILPKQRELKRHNALVAALAVGDDVMTGSGIYGTLTEVGADTVSLSIAPGVEIKVARRAIAAKVTSTAPAEEPGAAELPDDDHDGPEPDSGES